VIRSAQVYRKASSPRPWPRPKNTTMVRRPKNGTVRGGL
jgi:hypothetical protein